MARSQIIKDLANGTVGIQIALKRTKVLLQELNNQELLNWINYEIEGYPKELDVPDYRIINGELRGSYFKGSMARHMTYNNVPLPLGKMPQDWKESIQHIPILTGLEALKQIIVEADGKGLVTNVPADFYPNIAMWNDDPYMIITSAKVELNMPQILNIFSKVESRLLEILVFLEKQFGNLDELDINVETKTDDELTKITNHILLIIFNDNSVNIGNNNRIKDTTIASEIITEE